MTKIAIGKTIIAVILVIILVVVAVAALLLWPRTFKPLELTAHSIDPSEMTVGSFANLKFTIRNNDAMRSHDVKVVFNTTVTTFYLGNESLESENGHQFFPTSLQPSQQSSFTLRVTGTLPTGATTTTYLIAYDLFDENATKFDSATESLKLNMA
jgi:hypothetical protein